MPPDSYNEQGGQREQDAYVPRPINADPREQARWRTVPPQQSAMMGEKVQPLPQKRKRHGLRGCLITAVVVIVLLVGLAGFGTAAVFHGLPAMGPASTQTQTFSVSANPQLTIDDPVGTITVHADGTSNQIIVQATKQSDFPVGSNPNNTNVVYSPTSSGVAVTVSNNNNNNFLNFVNVNLDVTVPADSNLQLKTNVGDIEVKGVSGQMTLNSNTGSITAENDVLTGSSTLKTNVGSVNFDGQITDGDTYDFQSNTGSVNVTLPASTTFHVDAKTNTGSINSDFPVGIQKSTVGAEVHADVGNSPTTTITMRTNTGSITIGQSK